MRDSTAELIKIKAAKPWRPAAGDMIDGTVVKILRGVSQVKENDYYPILIVDTGEAGYTAVHAFHSLLIDQLREVKTKKDDEICIVYQGRVESKNDAQDTDPETGKKRKRTYHSYLLVSNGVDATVEFNWDDPAGGQADDEPPY